jgi:hypothetical protein
MDIQRLNKETNESPKMLIEKHFGLSLDFSSYVLIIEIIQINKKVLTVITISTFFNLKNTLQ